VSTVEQINVQLLNCLFVVKELTRSKSGWTWFACQSVNAVDVKLFALFDRARNVEIFKLLKLSLWCDMFVSNLYVLKGLEETEDEGVNTDVKFQVSSLTLILSKQRYPIAKIKAFGLFTRINMQDGNFAAEGKLSSVSVTDMSPHGTLYREK